MEIMKGTLITQDNQKISYEHESNNHDQVVVIAHGFYNSKDDLPPKKWTQRRVGVSIKTSS